MLLLSFPYVLLVLTLGITSLNVKQFFAKFPSFRLKNNRKECKSPDSVGLLVSMCDWTFVEWFCLLVKAHWANTGFALH